MCYGQDRDEAVAKVWALALRVIAERLEHREAPAEFVSVAFEAARIDHSAFSLPEAEARFAEVEDAFGECLPLRKEPADVDMARE